MADIHDDDLIKIRGAGSSAGDGAQGEGDTGGDELPEIEEATPEQARAMGGPKKAAAIAPAITLKSSGITVPIDDADQTKTAATRVRAPIVPKTPAQKKTGGAVVSGRPGGPPAKKPPAALSAPEPEGSFISRNRKWLIPLAIVLGLLLIVAIFMIVRSLTTPESDKIAVSANGLLTPVNEKIDDADKVTDFREAAHSAKSARAKMSALQQRANTIGNTKERLAVVALLDAQNSLLNAYSGLADVDRKNLKPVDDLSDQAKESARALESANAGMTAVGREGRVDEDLTGSAVDNMHDALADAQAAMAKWTVRFKRQKAKREKFTREANQLAAYSNQFEAQRSEVGRFYDAPPSQTFTSGGNTIDGFARDRSSLQSGVASFPVGRLLLGARGALAHALDMSVRAFPKLRKAWGAQNTHETVAESSFFPAYDRATNAVDKSWLIFKTKLGAAETQAKSEYKSPSMPDV